jgi:hypothetical protein
LVIFLRLRLWASVSGGKEKPMTLEEIEQMSDAEAMKVYDALSVLAEAKIITSNRAPAGRYEVQTDVVNTLIMRGGKAYAKAYAKKPNNGYTQTSKRDDPNP